MKKMEEELNEKKAQMTKEQEIENENTAKFIMDQHNARIKNLNEMYDKIHREYQAKIQQSQDTLKMCEESIADSEDKVKYWSDLVSQHKTESSKIEAELDALREQMRTESGEFDQQKQKFDELSKRLAEAKSEYDEVVEKIRAYCDDYSKM
jgi:chromosome segregation ATPase